MQKWVSVHEACEILGLAERTLRKHIKENKIVSMREGGKRLVQVEIKDQPTGDIHAQDMSANTSEQKKGEGIHEADMIQYMQNDIDFLRKRVEELERQLSEARQATEEASHRHDTVVMQMTKLLEYHQQPFWRRLFFRKALPSPVEENVVNMETHDDRERNGK